MTDADMMLHVSAGDPVRAERDALKKALEDLVHWKAMRGRREQFKIQYGEDNPYERACKAVGKE